MVAETIDAVRQLILEDRHVIYREIETSGTSIHSILHELLTAKKKFVRVGSHTICYSLKKINQSEWQKCFDNWIKRVQK